MFNRPPTHENPDSPYQDDHVKQGGNRFYACAGRYLLAYVDEIEPLLRTRKGKRADLHSMRTSGGSALEDSDAKQLQADDIMGHAREGMGPRKYIARLGI